MARYEWPPLPVIDKELASKRMGFALDRAWQDLEDERVRVAESLRLQRKALVDRTLAEFQAAIAQFGADVAYHLERFATLHLAPQYLEGVKQGGGTATWTAIHSQAFTSLALDTYDDFLQRSQQAERTSRAFAEAVREAASTELPKIAGRGLTAVQGGQRLEEHLLSKYGITHVTYRDGSRVPVKQYAEMAARTKSGVAYNSGTLNQGVSLGAEYFEVFDGPGCGWTGHRDPDTANGSIRHASECELHPLAHPNCGRGFGPRPDITSKKQAQSARGTATDAQNLDQAAAAEARAVSKAPMKNRPRQQARARTQAARNTRLAGGTPTVTSLAKASVARAEVVGPGIKQAVEKATIGNGGGLFRPETYIKDAGSAERKLLGDAMEKDLLNVADAVAKLSDSVRFTSVFSDAEYWAAGEKMIFDLEAAGHTFLKGPAGWAETGYRGRNMKFANPDGHIYEAQIHTRASLAAAEESHLLLDAQRLALTKAEADAYQVQMDAIFAAVPVPPGVPLIPVPVT